MNSGLRVSFGADIRAFAKVVQQRMDKVHRSVTMQLFTAVIYDTPVDTGLARGSWYPSLGAPMIGTPRVVPGATVAAEVEALMRNAPMSKIAYLSNHVPYVTHLEYGTASYGFSPKAPQGMVRINMVRIQTIINDVVAAARAGS